MGDSSPDADKLMRSQGVRALPSFHFVSGKSACASPRPFVVIIMHAVGASEDARREVVTTGGGEGGEQG